MSIPENLNTLHGEEERIRRESLNAVVGASALSDHLYAIHASMAVIMAIAQGHEHQSEDEKNVQYLGLRIFNNCAAALKLALSGYYQSAFAVVRDLYEILFLLDYFQISPNKISEWASADRRERIRKFGPATIRKCLDEHYGHETQKRKVIYERLSEYASHVTAPGFIIVAPKGLGRIGPFFDEKYLGAFIEELVKVSPHSGVVFIGFFKNLKRELLLEKHHFLKTIGSWQTRYFEDGVRNAP